MTAAATDSPPPKVARARRAVRPRDAATLIIVDRSAADPLVLMGRRNSGHGFMPGKWVFPGGRLAPCDFRLPCAGDLSRDVAAALEVDLTEERAQALAVAAIRETFEETGLLLGSPTQQICNRKAWRGFFSHGVAPDLSGLAFVGRLITPPQRPKRFDTRFFMADANRLVCRQPMDSRELEELDWFPMRKITELDLALPTRMMVREIEARFENPDRRPYFRRFRTPEG